MPANQIQQDLSKPDITTLNRPAGICGFTSALCSVYDARADLRNHLGHALRDEEHRHLRMQAEIKTFLTCVRAKDSERKNGSRPDGRDYTKLLGDIEGFTKSFGAGYSAWTIDSYIGQINTADSKTQYDIGMPKDAVSAYLDMMWELRSTSRAAGGMGEAIIGLASATEGKKDWDNLVHYVYRDGDGKFHNWGETFDSLAQVDKQMSKAFGKETLNLSASFEVVLHSVAGEQPSAGSSNSSSSPSSSSPPG